MTDLMQQTWAMVALILLIVLLILVIIIVHRYDVRRAHEKISEQIAGLPPSPEGTERILTAIEGARMQISSTGDELRGQHGTIKNRINWLIGQYDALIAMLMKVIAPKEPPK